MAYASDSQSERPHLIKWINRIGIETNLINVVLLFFSLLSWSVHPSGEATQVQPVRQVVPHAR